MLTPLTYQTPDYWDRYRQPSPESSVAFKSKTKRFDEDPKPTANEYEIELEIQSLSSPGRNLSRPSTTLSSTRSLRDVDERNSVYRVLKSRQKGFSFATSGITRPNSPSSIEDQSGLFDSSSVISHGGDTMVRLLPICAIYCHIIASHILGYWKCTSNDCKVGSACLLFYSPNHFQQQ